MLGIVTPSLDESESDMPDVLLQKNARNGSRTIRQVYVGARAADQENARKSKPSCRRSACVLDQRTRSTHKLANEASLISKYYFPVDKIIARTVTRLNSDDGKMVATPPNPPPPLATAFVATFWYTLMCVY